MDFVDCTDADADAVVVDYVGWTSAADAVAVDPVYCIVVDYTVAGSANSAVAVGAALVAGAVVAGTVAVGVDFVSYFGAGSLLPGSAGVDSALRWE